MNRSRIKSIAIEVIVSLYLVLFIYAALSKLFKFSDFQQQLGQSPVLNSLWVDTKVFAFGVPLIELAIVILLVIPRFRLIGLYAAGILMTMFTFYITGMLLFADKLPCSCGGVLQLLSWKQHLIFNIFYVFISVVAIIIYKRNKDVAIGNMQSTTL